MSSFGRDVKLEGDSQVPEQEGDFDLVSTHRVRSMLTFMSNLLILDCCDSTA